MATADVDDVSL